MLKEECGKVVKKRSMQGSGTVWQSTAKYDHAKKKEKIREINCLVLNFFSKNVDFTEKMLLFP